jgi:hypothetical protein
MKFAQEHLDDAVILTVEDIKGATLQDLRDLFGAINKSNVTLRLDALQQKE